MIQARVGHGQLKGRECINPATTYPPSDVSWTELATSSSLKGAPYVFCHWILPDESSFKTQKFSPSPLTAVAPATMYPPSDVSWTELATSSPNPPGLWYAFCHSMPPDESSFSTQTALDTPGSSVTPTTPYPPS